MSQQKLKFININIQLLWGVLKNSCFESWSKSLKCKREEVQFLARLHVCRLHRYFFKNFSKVSSLRVKWQLFLGTPFFENSSLQLLLNTRVKFDKSTVNFYFSMSIVKKTQTLNYYDQTKYDQMKVSFYFKRSLALYFSMCQLLLTTAC